MLSTLWDCSLPFSADLWSRWPFGMRLGWLLPALFCNASLGSADCCCMEALASFTVFAMTC